MDLAILQARWKLGLILPEDVPRVATDLLVTQIESKPLAALAGLVRAERDDVEPLLGETFREAGLAPVSDIDARWRIAYNTAQQIVDGAVTPLEGATVLWHLANDLGIPESLGSSIYLAADYAEGPRSREENEAWFDERIVETARELLAERTAST